MEEFKKLKILTKLDQMEKELGKVADQLPNELYWGADNIINELLSLEFAIERLDNKDDYDDGSEERVREEEVWK